MSETLTPPGAPLGSADVPPLGRTDTAGAMLREARERQGMHIAMLAAMMKVTPRKLEALEADRYDELPDLAFARALARTVCRTLKIDPEPVLAKLPQLAKPAGLEHAATGLNTPFREHGGSPDPQRFAILRRPMFWATFLVLAGAAAMALAPPAWLASLTSRGVGSSASSSSRASGSAPSATVTEVLTPSGTAGAAQGATSTTTVVATGAAGTTVSSPAAAATSSAAAAPAATATQRPDFVGPPRADPVIVETVHAAPPPGAGDGVAGVLVIRAKAEAWVEVVDGKGRSLIARTMHAGETVGIDGDAPFKLRLGNAPNTELRFRGEAVDVASRASGALARFELK